MKALQVTRSETLGGAGPPGAFIPSGIQERRGIQATTRATGQLAQNLFEFGQMVQTSVRRDMLLHSYALAQEDVTRSELDMRADPDWRSVPGKFRQSLDDIRAARSDEIPDPVARNMFQRKMIEYGITRERQMDYYTQSREIDAQKGHLIQELQIKSDAIENLNLDDMINYERLLAEGEDSINARTGFAVTEEVAAKLKISVPHDADILRADRSVMNNPWDALARLSKPSWKETFPFLSDIERREFQDKAQKRISSFDKLITQDKKEKKLAAKEELEASQDQVANGFMNIIFKGTTEDLLNFDTKDILDSILPETEGGNSKKAIIKMRQSEIDERLSGKRNPYKISDQKAVAKLLTRAMNGEIDPRDVKVIPGVISIDAMQTIRSEAKSAKEATGDTWIQQYQELKRLANSDGRGRIILGSDLLGTVDENSRTRANTFTQNLLKALKAEPNMEKRVNMLTLGTPEYIVDKLVIPNLLSISDQQEILMEKFETPELVTGATIRREAERLLKINNLPVSEAGFQAVQILKTNKLKVNASNLRTTIKRILAAKLKEEQNK